MDAHQHRRSNRLHSLFLILGMGAILALCGYLLAGKLGLVVALALAAGIIVVTGNASAAVVLRMYRAVPIQHQQAPDLMRLFDALVERSTLEYRPRLYYIPSSMLNAFATGRGDQVAVAVTDGLLRSLNGREMAGVLAHELSHIENDDVFVMTLADAFSRVTALLGQVGIWMLILALPAVLVGYDFPWLAGLVFLVAPSISALLQLALSRSREYDADEGGARLTGDPIGLAMALNKIEHRQGGWFERVFLPGRRQPDPALLRTHPKTADRISLLKSMAGVNPALPLPGSVGFADAMGQVRRVRPPRWHLTGLWY